MLTLTPSEEKAGLLLHEESHPLTCYWGNSISMSTMFTTYALALDLANDIHAHYKLSHITAVCSKTFKSRSSE